MPEQRLTTPNGPLTPLQDRFVDEYVANGGEGLQAARAAGYTSQHLDHRVNDLLKQPTVLAEIRRRTAQALGHLAPKALQTLGRLTGAARSEYVQLQAAIDLLDRLGMRAPERQEYAVGDLKVIIDLSGDDTPRG
jgi:phage terminase small subunit